MVLAPDKSGKNDAYHTLDFYDKQIIPKTMRHYTKEKLKCREGC